MALAMERIPVTQEPRWHRKAVGGMWEEVGLLQFEFLVEQGLRPEHYLLDIRCGSLRGGRHFIPFLEPGHYFGIDPRPELLRAGLQHEVDPNLRNQKRPVLVPMEDFGFERLEQAFDFALAHSVLIHLPLNAIIRCLVSVADVLTPNGQLYATFFENPGGKRNLDPVVHERGGLTTYSDADPYHHDFETLAGACKETGLEVKYIGEWNDPRDQKMLLFTRSGAAGRS